MKKLLLIILLSALGFTVNAQYYQLRYDSVGIRSKLILSTVTTGTTTDSLLTKKANGGVYKISQASLQQLISTGTNSQFYRGDKTFQTFGTIWGQTYNGTNNIVGALTGVTSIDMTGKLTVSKTPTVTGDIALEVSQIGSTVNHTYTGQKITASNTNGTTGFTIGLDITSSVIGTGVGDAQGILVNVNSGSRISGNTANNKHGVYAIINGSTAVSSTATSQNYYGIRGSVLNSTAIGETGSNYGGYFTAATATSQTAYGVYSSATGGTNSWGIYSNAGKNYFNGNTLIGTTTDNGEKLQVNGKVTVATAPTNATDVVRKTELDLKAPIASPTFTGTPTLPTGTIAVKQALNDNSTKIATTSFVKDEFDDRTGWASYTDTVYTSASPFTINAGVTSTLPNNRGTSIKTQLPSGVTDFYDGTKITPKNNGDYYDISILFKAKNSSPTGGYFDFGLDLGGSLGIQFRKSELFIKGADTEQQFNISFGAYSAATFVANGGIVKITSGTGTTSIYDIIFQINRTHKAK